MKFLRSTLFIILLNSLAYNVAMEIKGAKNDSKSLSGWQLIKNGFKETKKMIIDHSMLDSLIDNLTAKEHKKLLLGVALYTSSIAMMIVNGEAADFSCNLLEPNCLKKNLPLVGFNIGSGLIIDVILKSGKF